MRIAIASGKGGTGKTTVATNLARTLANLEVPVSLLDCDVEEPDCHLFLRPRLESRRAVTVPLPQVDQQRCTSCGTCEDVCAFNAISVTRGGVLVFPDLCEGCGACIELCPAEAITEVGRPIGVIESGTAGPIRFWQGQLNVGEPKAPPVIAAVKAEAMRSSRDKEVVLIDAPPGTSCPVIEAVRGADLVLLVAEPTPFGLHDLSLALEAVQALGLPAALVINRANGLDNAVQELAAKAGIEIVARIPDDRRIAEAYSVGELAVSAVPGAFDLFVGLWQRLAR
jgi:MinD superfamily P-loop ATPase